MIESEPGVAEFEPVTDTFVKLYPAVLKMKA
jgi:hypothetical protein